MRQTLMLMVAATAATAAVARCAPRQHRVQLKRGAKHLLDARIVGALAQRLQARLGHQRLEQLHPPQRQQRLVEAVELSALDNKRLEARGEKSSATGRQTDGGRIGV